MQRIQRDKPHFWAELTERVQNVVVFFLWFPLSSLAFTDPKTTKAAAAAAATTTTTAADVFLEECSCSFYDPMDADNLISGSSGFCKSSLNIWKFTVHILLKPDLENFEHYFASV